MNLEKLNAYELIEEQDLSDLASKGILLRHKKTGAKIALVENDDDNKVFYIAFRTPVDDATGVPHIIEHSVLCGSDDFPVKDPFVELAKGSLNTFLNAMTYPDKTIYPVASCNDKDFRNLIHVYLDAVFHPNIYKHKEIFLQEGWHYELEDIDAPLEYNGVVYNEMKGAFSSPEGVLDRVILNSLFPDTTYANESGGDPSEIPNLTYEEFLAFHGRYYHPSNSYIYLYGKMDMEEKLQWIDENYLSKYDYLELDSTIKRQEAFEKPVEVTKEYSISSGESKEDKTYLAYNLVVDTVLNPEYYLAFDVLDYALLSAPGAPLRQALLDEGIGKDIMSSYDNSTYQPIFSIVAKNTNASEKDHMLAVIKRVLQEQVENGLSKKALMAGINSAEFKYREADFGGYPKGLIYGLQCMDSWLYDDHAPFMHLQAGPLYEALRQKIETGYFEQLVEEYLLNNTHASIVVIEPKQGLTAEKEAEVAARLQAYKDTLTKEQLEQLVADTAYLKEYQETPSPKEDLMKIPLLQRGDIGRSPQPFINEVLTLDDVKVVFHETNTNGIYYLDYVFDMNGVTEELLPYVGILKAVLGYCDTPSFSYADLANEINLYTGGISSAVNLYEKVHEPGVYDARYEVRAKTLPQHLEKTLSLISEILNGTKLTDEKRLYEILAQAKSRLEMTMTTAGHGIASVRAMSYFSKNAAFTDAMSGIRVYRVIADIESHFEEKKEELIANLQKVVDIIFRKEQLLVSITCDKEQLEGYKTFQTPFLASLNQAPKCEAALDLHCEKRNEGFKNASQVQYVARAGNFKNHGYDYEGALRILRVIMNYDYLWINIRVKGGAYGCMSGFGKNGDTYFVSYRDPNLKKTNEIFEGISNYVKNFDADERDMTKYVIGTVSEMDTPLTPAIKGARSFTAYMCGITSEDIQKERNQVLDATADDIRKLADLLESVLKEQNLCVIGNEGMLTKEETMFEHLEELF